MVPVEDAEDESLGSPMRYAEAGEAKPVSRSSTGALSGAVAAVIKRDTLEAPTCVYNEFVAARIGELAGVAVASGVLTQCAESIGFASLIAASSGARLPHIHKRLAGGIARRYPCESAGLFVFDVLIGNWDRASNVKASLSKATPFFCGFDHGNSLLMAAGPSLDESIAAMSSGETILHQHLFGVHTNDQWISAWVARFQSLPRDLIAHRCLVGYRINDVDTRVQLALAEALRRRLDALDSLCSQVLELCRGGE